MLTAELRGKLSAKLEKSEDILTSNVFSFFKYADRQIFLMPFLRILGIYVSDADVENAEFQFWPQYADNTEPDLVIIVGRYYLLFEAKYLSSFEWKEDQKLSQLYREAKGGLFEAQSLGKEFYLIAVTADYLYQPDDFNQIKNEIPPSRLKWISWQRIGNLLLEILDSQKLSNTTFIFCQDLCALLDKKNLRYFRDFKSVLNIGEDIIPIDKIFLAYETTALRGSFIGFQPTLRQLEQLTATPSHVFFKQVNFFDSIKTLKGIKPHQEVIFFGRV